MRFRSSVSLFASCTLALIACSSSADPTPDEHVATASAAVVPACSYDPVACPDEPFALGAWIGTSGRFAALVLSDQPCGDYGFCFVGELADGTHVAGTYFHRPQLVLFTWPGGAQAYEGYDVVGGELLFYAGAEGSQTVRARLRSVPSWCGVASDCELQTLPAHGCDTPTWKCHADKCHATCARPKPPHPPVCDGG